jgi:hypothetical protein
VLLTTDASSGRVVLPRVLSYHECSLAASIVLPRVLSYQESAELHILPSMQALLGGRGERQAKESREDDGNN